MRRLLTDFLRRDGYTVLTASDGREALELFDQHPETAVAVLDVMMPEVDGWTVCRHIRTRSSIPIIMLTARSEEHDQLFGFEIGATDYVTKPFSPRVLVARIRAHLSTRTAAPSPDDQAVRLDRSAHRLYIDGDEVELSPK